MAWGRGRIVEDDVRAARGEEPRPAVAAELKEPDDLVGPPLISDTSASVDAVAPVDLVSAVDPFEPFEPVSAVDPFEPVGPTGTVVDASSERWFEEMTPSPPEPILLDWPPKPAPRQRRTSATRSLVEWTLVIGGALALALLIRTFAIQTFKIPSESMQSTLLVKDRVLVNKLSYRVHDIHRGDVIVFTRPPKETNTDIKDLIKRVVGLPGESVEGRDGHILIDGRTLTEPYLDPGKATTDFAPVTIPAGSIFVMGDNRDHSQDSRFFGPIEQRTVVGRAFLRIWPFGRLGWL